MTTKAIETDRIARLEQTIAEASAELQALKGQPPKPVAPKPDDRPMLSYIDGPSHFVRPTEKELRRLADVVIARYPKIGPRRSQGLLDDAGDFHTGFCWAFERLGFSRRASKPDVRHYVQHWADETKDWLALNRPNACGNIGGAFLCACLAHGDICFTPADLTRGVVWSVGLTNFGGKLASDRWKRVLDGELLPPTAPVMPARSY